MNWCDYANMFIWWLVIGLGMMGYDEVWWDMMRYDEMSNYELMWLPVEYFSETCKYISKMGCRYVTFTMRIPKFLEKPFVARNRPMNIPYHTCLGFTLTLGIVLWPRVEQRKLILAKNKNKKKNIITKKTNRQKESPEKTKRITRKKNK